eukprot:g56434.t1
MTSIEENVVALAGDTGRYVVALAGDTGRSLLTRALLPLFNPNCPVLWLGLHDMDHTTPESRATFLRQVEDAFRAF